VSENQQAVKDEVLGVIRRVAAEAARRGDEIDQARKFPKDLFDQVAATGAFQVLAPKQYNGLELSLADMNEIVYEAARGNGSFGWLMMVGSAQGVGLGLFAEQTVARLMREHPRLRIRGAIAPKGVAVPVDGGYMVSGQWPFASGGPNPDYIAGNCIVLHDGKPRIGPSGFPDAVIAMVRADEAEFLDTWHVLGMRGSDSCDFVIKDRFVPHAHAYNMYEATTCFDTPSTRVPLRVGLSTGHCALALGVAQGAMDDITELAKTKRSAMNPNARLADDVVFRDELGRRIVRLAAAKSLMEQVTQKLLAAGEVRRDLTPDLVLLGRLMSHHITDHCAQIVDWAYTAAGSSSVYNGSSLQRRLRDIHVATQHAACHPEAYRSLGALALGETVPPKELF
jgi:alkylation response protein AidB-like acyl-CoA dehydrogenase